MKIIATGVSTIKEASTSPRFNGEVLLCEDSEVSQYAIQALLKGVGFEVVLAKDGKEGVAEVKDRMENGKKQFDVICMDIYMPVMDGLKATYEIRKMGCDTPIIALSANTEPADIENYRRRGIFDAVNKPIVLQDLFECLYKYIEPVCFVELDEEKHAKEQEKRQERLLRGFVNRNQTTFTDITNAIESGDIKLAHRLAHTLRGLAGLMNETALQDCARAVEHLLAQGTVGNMQKELEALSQELGTVLDKLSPYLDDATTPEPEVTDFDRQQATRLFDKLEELLKADDAICVKLSEELKEIPKTKQLIAKVDEYEFEEALEILSSLRKDLGV